MMKRVMNAWRIGKTFETISVYVENLFRPNTLAGHISPIPVLQPVAQRS